MIRAVPDVPLYHLLDADSQPQTLDQQVGPVMISIRSQKLASK